MSETGLDLARERAALLAIHEQDRRAHLTTDPALLLEHAAREFLYVGDGELTRLTHDQVAADFERLFTGATYDAWDDLEPPVVAISDDASMAWMVVRVRVSRRHTDDEGREVERSFVYAGIMTYEKQHGTWVRVANVSTFAR